jgi:hypothetical protein
MRVWFKKFVRIPINTADHVFKLIAGDMKGYIETSINRIREKLENRTGEARPP